MSPDRSLDAATAEFWGAARSPDAAQRNPGHLWQAEVALEIPFHDVDVMGVAWHGHYMKYFEAARGALLRALDYDYPQMRDSGFLWPVVECQLKYIRPARYSQKLRVTALLVEYENRLKIAYEVFDAGSGERLTRGHTIQVAVDAVSEEMQFVSPRALLERVERNDA